MKKRKSALSFKKMEDLVHEAHDKNNKKIQEMAEKQLEHSIKVLENRDYLIYEKERRKEEILTKEISALKNTDVKDYNIQLKQSIIR